MALSDDIADLPVTPSAGQTGRLADTTVLHAAAKSHQSRLDNLPAPSGSSGSVPATVAYAATVTPGSGVTVLTVGALTGNLTLANPAGAPADGQTLRLRLAQDATGGRTITFGTNYVFGTDVTANLIPTAASARFELLFSWHAGDTKWRAIGLSRGF